jgi:YfiH family protein
VKAGWIVPDWPAPPNVRAFTTTREGGASAGPWSGFNLGSRCGDDPAHVERNRSSLEDSLPAPVTWLRQVHGTGVVRMNADMDAEPEAEADAAVAFEPGRVCAILTADCLPVFFCNRRGDRVGVAHAGWRGLADGVLQATVEALDEDPAELLAWLGPAIGPETYEVGEELVPAFAAEFPSGFTRRGDRYLLDLYSLARLKLADAGLHKVGGGGFCTFSDSRRFFSYRRDGVTGRMASVIWMQPHVTAD